MRENAAAFVQRSVMQPADAVAKYQGKWLEVDAAGVEAVEFDPDGAEETVCCSGVGGALASESMDVTLCLLGRPERRRC
jgi:hypothetical protein